MTVERTGFAEEMQDQLQAERCGLRFWGYVVEVKEKASVAMMPKVTTTDKQELKLKTED